MSDIQSNIEVMLLEKSFMLLRLAISNLAQRPEYADNYLNIMDVWKDLRETEKKLLELL